MVRYFWFLVNMFLLLLPGCEKQPFVPGDDATIYLEAKPAEILPGKSCTVCITGVKANGYPLPDDTKVDISSDCGEIENQVLLKNGYAELTLTCSEICTDEISVTARSGLAQIVPESLAVTVINNKTEIAFLYISANPTNLPVGGGKSTITVLAVDADMAPVPDMLIWLETTAGTLNGNSFTTDTNGKITTKLHTSEDATVTARHLSLNASITIDVEAAVL